MRPLITTAVAVQSLFMILAPMSARAQAVYVPGEMIVRMRSDAKTSHTSLINRLHKSQALHLKAHFTRLNMAHFALPEGKDVLQAVKDVKSDPDVLYAEPNYIVHKADAAIGDRYPYNEPAGAGIDLAALWTSSLSVSRRPIVAVIDSGLDITHPVIKGTGALWTNPNEIPDNKIDDDGNGYVDDVHGWNFVAGTGQMSDDDGHGTHVCGIVLSADQNIFATTLRAAKIQIMPLKFLDGAGSGSIADAIRAIDYAIANGASVLNSSWAGPSYSVALQEAISASYNSGAIFVAAAGNDSLNDDSNPFYPASFDVPNVLTVAATTSTDTLASFSNYGASTVHIGSPGVSIPSLWPGGGFMLMSGTSMATPFVAGVAAQMKAVAPQMLGYQIKSILMSQSDAAPALQGKLVEAGRLNAAHAVSFAATAPIETSQPAYQMQMGRDPASSPMTAGAGGCNLIKGASNGMGASNMWVILVLIALQLTGFLFLRVRAVVLSRKSHPKP